MYLFTLNYINVITITFIIRIKYNNIYKTISKFSK